MKEQTTKSETKHKNKAETFKKHKSTTPKVVIKEEARTHKQEQIKIKQNQKNTKLHNKQK